MALRSALSSGGVNERLGEESKEILCALQEPNYPRYVCPSVRHNGVRVTLRELYMTATNDELEAARQAGRIEGQIDALEKMQHRQNDRLDHHDRRLSTQEKITWGILGAIALIQSIDAIRTLTSIGSKGAGGP